MSYLTDRTGNRFYFKDLGDGPAVLLVHSWALDSSIWEYQIPALVEAGYRCVAMDRRGHGRSDEPGGDYALDTLADDLATLLDDLLCEPVVRRHDLPEQFRRRVRVALLVLVDQDQVLSHPGLLLLADRD